MSAPLVFTDFYEARAAAWASPYPAARVTARGDAWVVETRPGGALLGEGLGNEMTGNTRSRPPNSGLQASTPPHPPLAHPPAPYPSPEEWRLYHLFRDAGSLAKAAHAGGVERRAIASAVDAVRWWRQDQAEESCQ